MKKIAITGSKGKTTILFLLQHVFRNLDKNVLRISPNEDAFYNEQFLRVPEYEGYLDEVSFTTDYKISEACSSILEKDIYENENNDIGVYTGIEEFEHSETHGNFENYLKAKKKIAECSKVLVVNNDDEHWQEIVKDFEGKVITVGTRNADFRYSVLSKSSDKMVIQLSFYDMLIELDTFLLGEYNALNVTLAFAVLVELGLINSIFMMSSFKGVAGRFERIKMHNGMCIIDYAHTHKSLEYVINNIRDIYQNKKIVTIFGCGGERGKEKRPLMGKVAYELSDYIIITSDNSRSEDKKEILADIENGFTGSNYYVITEREDAVEFAVNIFDKEDWIILLAGKGNEKGIINDGKIKLLTDKELLLDKLKESEQWESRKRKKLDLAI